jgi:FlaA1/EpsC-like NDP-sugar epimerase
MSSSTRLRILRLVIIDIVLIIAALYIALLLRFEGHIPLEYSDAFHILAPVNAVISIALLFYFKLYNRVWEYASLNELLAIFEATIISGFIFIILSLETPLPNLPRSVFLINWGLVFFFISSLRIYWRIFRDEILNRNRKDTAGRRCLIVGAGDAGAIVAKEIQQNHHLTLKLIGFIDDDPRKQGRILAGIPVLGYRTDIPQLSISHKIEEIIIAMPSASGKTIREIVKLAKKTSARLRILPGIYDSTSNPVSSLRDISMEDLLGREAVKIDLTEISGYLTGKTVLITGAGGSIGSEMCRQIADFAPEKLIIIDNCENNLFDIEQELLEKSLIKTKLHTELLDVKNRDKLMQVFAKYQPQVVFHAAAYKHVPMMENHPEEALQNNVYGTKNTAEMADKYGCETFILISTDKAVNPSSVMGASKRIAELIIKDLNRSSKTRFASVRFGNVLGSRGSVIPTFMKQIEKGGPVTVTHPSMTRYFMTIPEAVALVIQAGALAEGGEIFVLDMGEPVRIADLARDIITISGYQPDKEIMIQYTGVRPGEKLYEELFTDKEGMQSTKHERIFISQKQLDEKYEGIINTVNILSQKPVTSRKEIIKVVSTLVPEYRRPLTEVNAEIALTEETRKLGNSLK